MRQQGRTVEAILAEFGTAAAGVVTRVELLVAGITPAEIRWRLRTGALIPKYPGVYLVGHAAPSLEANYLAAVRACGDGALLCGLAAASLHGIRNGSAPPPEVLTRTERRVKGVTTRRTKRPHPADATVCRGVPVTTVPRTLVDLAARLSADALARACHEAGVRHGTRPADVEAVLTRRPTSPGARKLRSVLHGDVRVTLSKLERRFLELLEEDGLPLPQTNRVASGRRVDCRWPEQRLTVELDSYRYHNSRYSWQQDRLRERAARLRGDEFRRYSWSDVFEDSSFMRTELEGLLLRQ